MNRWAKQTNTTATQGNCTQTCVAAILNLPLSQVPNFIREYEDVFAFWRGVEKFFFEKNYLFTPVQINYCPRVLYLASGISPRGHNHMVVMYSDYIFFDPHPDNSGIDVIDCKWTLLPIDPGEFIVK